MPRNGLQMRWKASRLEYGYASNSNIIDKASTVKSFLEWKLTEAVNAHPSIALKAVMDEIQDEYKGDSGLVKFVAKSSVMANAIIDQKKMDRGAFLDAIATKYNTRRSYQNDKGKNVSSSIGVVYIDKVLDSGKAVRVTIGAKPLSGSGKARGASNEERIVNMISSALHGEDGVSPLDIVFTDGKKASFSCRGIIDVVNCSKDTAGGKKADFQLISISHGIYNISLKQDDAEGWESMDKKVKKPHIEDYAEVSGTFDKLNQPIDNDSTTLLKLDKKTSKWEFKKPYTSGVAWKPSRKLAHAAVFGTDISGKNGCIIQKTFKDGEVCTIDGEAEPNPKTIIYVTKIINTLKDIDGTEEEPWVHIRNDKSRTGYRSNGNTYDGIRATMAFKKRVWGRGKKNTVLNAGKG